MRDWLSERTAAIRTEWALGIEARVRALLSDGPVADGPFRESIQRLGRTRIGAELARSHLLYGEWLRGGGAGWTRGSSCARPTGC